MEGPLVFRASPLTVLFAVALLVCVTPVALTAPGGVVLYLLPIGLVCWVLRVRTTVDPTAIVARGALRTRRVAWEDVISLRLRTRSRISAVLAGGAELPLPAVHTRDLPLLAQASGGRLPDLSQDSSASQPPDPGEPPHRTPADPGRQANGASADPGRQPDGTSADPGQQPDGAPADPGHQPDGSPAAATTASTTEAARPASLPADPAPTEE